MTSFTNNVSNQKCNCNVLDKSDVSNKISVFSKINNNPDKLNSLFRISPPDNGLYPKSTIKIPNLIMG